MRSLAAAFLLGVTLLATPTRAFEAAETYRGDTGSAGLLYLPNAAVRRDDGAAVLLVHDRLGLDGRSHGYIEQLTAAGLPVLELELGSASADGALVEAPQGETAAAALTAAIAALATRPGVDRRRIGAIGFGSGAQALVLLGRATETDGDPLAARVLLYPGCTELAHLLQGAQAAGRPHSGILLLHGEADPANPPGACAALTALLAETAPTWRIAFRGAGYAWDRPPLAWSEATLLPVLADETAPAGRVAVRYWPELAQMSAAQATGFLAQGLRAVAP